MKNKCSLQTLYAILLILLFSSIDLKAGKRPNILYIMSDDHSALAIGAYNSRLKNVVKTPNIDKLSEEGALLTRCYATNSLCAPSRASIITGKYSHKSGVYTLREDLNTANMETLPKVLQQGGYQTAVIGKWHVHGDNLYGFDYYAITYSQGAYINPSLSTKEGKIKKEGYTTDIYTDLSLEWLEKRDKSKPFFLMTHHKAVHAPMIYAPRHENIYDGITIPEPETLFDNYENRDPNGLAKSTYPIHDPEKGKSLSIRFSSPEKNKDKSFPTGRLDLTGMNDEQKKKATYQKLAKDYLRCVVAIDENVGRMIKYLEDEGELENTIVIYTSDQGYFIGEHGFYDKRFGLEESALMPFIIRYPKKIKKGMVIDDIINNVDFPETLIDFAGLETPKEMQGISFHDLLIGKKPKKKREATFYHFYSSAVPKQYGIITKDYKMLKYPSDKGTGEILGADLFDLKNDPLEMNNVYKNPNYKNIVEQMEQLLQEEIKTIDIAQELLPGGGGRDKKIKDKKEKIN